MGSTPAGRDVAASAAMVLLAAVLAARLIVGIVVPAPARAAARLGAGSPSGGATPREVVVVPTTTDDAGPASGPVTVTADRSMRALLRSYGHTELPVVLTLDAEGHVVRARPLTRPPSTP